MLECLEETFKSPILIVWDLLLWRTIFGSWRESEKTFKAHYFFTREEPLMVLRHVIFLSLRLWRTFKSSSRMKRWRTFLRFFTGKWRTFYGSSILSIIWRSLSLVQIAKDWRSNLWPFWRAIEQPFFSESVSREVTRFQCITESDIGEIFK